jgi:uncharacterized membrane protein
MAGLFEATIPPPFYRLIMGVAMLVWPDPFWAPRMMTFFFGLGALAAVCWLAHELFRSRMVVGLTAVLGAVLPCRVLLGLVPLAEVFYLVFVTAALAATMRWLRLRRTGAALTAAVLFALAAGVRYEAWVFCAVFGAVVVIRRLAGREESGLSWSAVGGIAAILAAFPVAWLLIHLAQHGSLEWIAGSTGPRFESRFGESLRRLLPRTLPVVFVTGNLASLQMIGLVSVVLFARRRRLGRWWLTIPVVAFVVLSVLAVTSSAVPSHNFWRTPAAWSLLLVPFTAHLLVMQGRLVRRPEFRVQTTAILLALVVLAGLIEISRITRDPNFVPSELHAARHVETLLGASDDGGALLIDSSRMRYYHIRTASRVPDRFVMNTGRDPRSPSPPVVVAGGSGAVYVHKLNALKIRYALFIDPPSRGVLNAHPRFKRIQRFGRWTLYEIVERRPSTP